VLAPCVFVGHSRLLVAAPFVKLDEDLRSTMTAPTTER
jgi:hypothetical protein